MKNTMEISILSDLELKINEQGKIFRTIFLS